MFESLLTNPALWLFTLLTMADWVSIAWDPKIKDIPPSFASATASLSSETDCMIAETRGMFISIAGCSPFLYLTTGVLKLTFSALHSFDEYPGTSRYSLNVLDGSLKKSAIFRPPYLSIYSSKVISLSVIVFAASTPTYLKCQGSYIYPVMPALPLGYLKINPYSAAFSTSHFHSAVWSKASVNAYSTDGAVTSTPKPV